MMVGMSAVASLQCQLLVTGRRPPKGACRALLDSTSHQSSNGSQSSRTAGQQQPTSIQHPSALFPEPQQQQRGPLLVQTQRGTPTFVPVVADVPCRHCEGLGKTTCGDCRGKGRINHRGATMLPAGVWPQWCPTCRASGRWCCLRCMGTGVRRQPIGFRVEPVEEDMGT
ncbi:hypothetical protein D9Q98_007418 [Chlorella vulgaris]|uniref:Uncharacterized protein n=1 Tax=Chlorella vulgaris TaxID=3077 RepID=A0A9D4YVV2_CHLVU|nr:hypothetical protein D9Q98_007418 [Chlorella vulgaris]